MRSGRARDERGPREFLPNEGILFLPNVWGRFVTFSELVLQLRVADGLGGGAHLPQNLLQAPHAADDAPWGDGDERCQELVRDEDGGPSAGEPGGLFFAAG